MATSTPSDLLAALRTRYAVKKFDATRAIPADVWHALEESLRLSPSSFGLQPWKFFVVKDPALRAKLVPLSWGQTQVTEASHFVVLAHRRTLDATDVDRLIDASAAARGVPASSFDGYRKMLSGSVDNAVKQGTAGTWNARQVYIALGFLMNSAAVLGIDSCPMEGIDPAGYDKVLGLEGTGYQTSVACALGYRAADDKYAHAPKVRFPASEVIQTL
jgi:nitroreductase